MRLCLSVFLGLLAGCASTPKGDPYFGPVGMQLAQTPNASTVKLKTAPKPKRQPASFSEGALEIDSAQGWAKLILKRAYQPPVGTPFVLFPKESGKYDVIRAAYSVGGQRIEVAQSRYLFSMRIDGAKGCSSKDAEVTAKQMLSAPKGFRFVPTARRPGMLLGKSNVPPPPEDAADWGADWMSEMHWWCSRAAMGFLTLKAAGDPTGAGVTLDEETNKNWF